MPTLQLLAQTIDAYRLAIGAAGLGRVVAVCSDRALTRRHALDLHAEVTTDPQHLHHLAAGRCTVFTTYASLAGPVAAAHRDHAMPPWDLVVVDEAHRTAGDLGRPWSAVHADAQIPARRRLYMTATPRLITANIGREIQVVSMDDPDVYGPVVHRLSFASAIDLELLADYRVLVSVVAEAEVRDLIHQHPFLELAGRPVDAGAIAAHITLLRAADQYALRRVITFHTRVARAQHFATTLPLTARAVGRDPQRLSSMHLAAAHRPSRRRDVLDQLHGDDDRLVVVANARLLNEGVDMPAVDGLMFADPRGSTIETIQAVGRGLRRGDQPDKIATMIIPVLVLSGQEPDLLGHRSPYAGVWEVLRALRAHDARAATALDDLRGRHRLQQPGQSRPALPGWLHAEGVPLPDGFLDAITAAAVEVEGTFERQWQRYFAAAAAYRHQHGHLRIPQRWVSQDGLAVGAWLNTQRRARAQRRLPDHRVAMLDDIGMIWHVRDDLWTAAYAAAEAYVAEHGHLHPVGTYTTADGVKLGWWLTNLRARSDAIPPERLASLERLDPDWNPPWDRSWHRALIHARRFRQQYGHLNVPWRYKTPDGYGLGEWVRIQRQRSVKLTAKQCDALTAIGMNWGASATREQLWTRGYTAAASYARERGHLNVPRGYVTPSGFKLGEWISNIRQRYKAGKVPEHRWHALRELGILATVSSDEQPG
ncbi:DEAD/DEAH box helicase [Dactylosporangium darangshiense]|uniref:DEAD/DEAH box helicase n=1 Tax=Dactylosporangium darangshiense TaxID=579108 RepID=A0ABP8DTV7_9ACTN